MQMDYTEYYNNEKNTISVLEGDGYNFISRFISRESSVGLSSRIYYRNPSQAGVPFKWEMQPGTPKNPPRKEVIPQPTPPPAVQSSWLPKPKPTYSKEHSKRSKILFWKKSKKNINEQVNCKIQRGDDHHVLDLDMYEIFELGESDGEFIGSGHDSRISMSSTSLSSNGHDSNLQSRFGRRDDDHSAVKTLLGCSPWDMTELLNEEEPSTYYDQERRTACANQNDGVLFKTIVSRTSSMSKSSRLYYRIPGSVPFEWEMLPGTSRNPAKEDIIPPPAPPPAVQSMGLTTPKFEVQPKTASTGRNRILGFWKKCKTSKQNKNFQELSIHKFQKLEFHKKSFSSTSSNTLSLLSSKIWKKVAKPSCYGAPKLKSIVNSSPS